MEKIRCLAKLDPKLVYHANPKLSLNVKPVRNSLQRQSIWRCMLWNTFKIMSKPRKHSPCNLTLVYSFFTSYLWIVLHSHRTARKCQIIARSCQSYALIIFSFWGCKDTYFHITWGFLTSMHFLEANPL